MTTPTKTKSSPLTGVPKARRYPDPKKPQRLSAALQRRLLVVGILNSEPRSALK